MILIDTSAWVEFLRDTGSATCNRVEILLENEIAICDVVRMEVLAGAIDEVISIASPPSSFTRRSRSSRSRLLAAFLR